MHASSMSRSAAIKADGWAGSRPLSAYSRAVGSGFHDVIVRVAATRFLVLEVGDVQAAHVAAVLEDEGYRGVRITRDLAGIERVVEGAR